MLIAVKLESDVNCDSNLGQRRYFRSPQGYQARLLKKNVMTEPRERMMTDKES